MSSIDILLIVTDQSFRLKESIGRVERARSHAMRAGNDVYVTAVPLHATESTLSWLEEFPPPGWTIAANRVGDLTDVLGAAIAASSADLVTVIEPDDLVCEDWLTLCAEQPVTQTTCWMPEAFVTYGPNYFTRGESAFFQLPAQLDASHISERRNIMPAGFVGPRSALATHPFPRADEERGWGSPGWNHLTRWWWVCRLLAGGIEFRAVPGTLHYRALPDGNDPMGLLTFLAGQRIGPYLADR
jgi:hypothetical protein